jgi:hypothetical protein
MLSGAGRSGKWRHLGLLSGFGDEFNYPRPLCSPLLAFARAVEACMSVAISMVHDLKYSDFERDPGEMITLHSLFELLSDVSRLVSPEPCGAAGERLAGLR